MFFFTSFSFLSSIKEAKRRDLRETGRVECASLLPQTLEDNPGTNERKEKRSKMDGNEN